MSTATAARVVLGQPETDVPVGGAKEAPPHAVLDIDRLASGWQRSLDAAARALDAAPTCIPVEEVGARRSALAVERARTARLLVQLSATCGARSVAWISPVPVTRPMLALPSTARACLFDLDGVLTNSGALHAWAWSEVFDDLLLRLSQRADRHFVRFDRNADYRDYIDGRPRLVGIHGFLESRGIRLPEGRPTDPATAETAYGIARRKADAFARHERQHGINALAGARRYLQAAGYAGLGRAVVSASALTLPMLETAGLAPLVEVRIDADRMASEHLRSRPAPDVLRSACSQLGVRPDDAVAFTHSPEGVAAGHAAGMSVIGIGGELRTELLRGFGADRVAPTLAALLDGRLTA